MNLVLLGPPGAGKGTQAAKLSKAFSIPRIATGDMLRSEVSKGSALGKEAQGYMRRGVLVPDEIIIEMVASRLSMEDCLRGFILDGFPRTRGQAEVLEGLAHLDVVVAIDVGEEVVVKRLAGRRECRQCQTVYNIKHNPPRSQGTCDNCGGELFQRADDKEEVVRERFRTYMEQTRPLLEFYRDRRILEEVDGRGSIQAVHAKILDILDSRGHTWPRK